MSIELNHHHVFMHDDEDDGEERSNVDMQDKLSLSLALTQSVVHIKQNDRWTK